MADTWLLIMAMNGFSSFFARCRLKVWPGD